MIGKYDKKRKEQKKLLKELESIKSLLDDGELIDDDYSELTETALKKSIDEEPPAHQQDDDEPEQLINDDVGDDFLISDELEIDLSTQDSPPIDEANIPLLQEMVVDDEPKTNLAPGVLPGQQSLFEEGSTEKTSELAAEAATSPAKNETKVPQKPDTKAKPTPPKPKTTENPFLPKHIRDRLNGTVDIPAYAHPNETIRSPYIAPPNPAGTHAAPSNSSYAALDDINQQEMIDALINEFMPKIESKLRIRLAQLLSKPPTK